MIDFGNNGNNGDWNENKFVEHNNIVLFSFIEIIVYTFIISTTPSYVYNIIILK